MGVSFVARKCTQCAGRLQYIKEKKLWKCLYCGAEIERQEQYDGLFTIKNVVRQCLLDTAFRRLDSAAKNLVECEKIDSRYVGTLIAKITHEMISVITPGACSERDVRNLFAQLKKNYELLRGISPTVTEEEEVLYEFLEEPDIFATLVLVYDSLNDSARRDYVLQMLKWAIYDDNDQTNIQVRKFGFQNTKAWFKSAVDRFDAKLQEAFPSEYKLHIDTWDGISNGNDQSEQVESIKNHFENNKFQNMFVNTPNIAAAILFIASAGLAFVTLYSLIVTALAAGFLGFRVFKAIQGYPVRVQAALDNLNAVMNEIAEFRRYYEEQRAKKSELLSTVEFL